jgi:hypothetical protein
MAYISVGVWCSSVELWHSSVGSSVRISAGTLDGLFAELQQLGELSFHVHQSFVQPLVKVIQILSAPLVCLYFSVRLIQKKIFSVLLSCQKLQLHRLSLLMLGCRCILSTSLWFGEVRERGKGWVPGGGEGRQFLKRARG